MSLYKGDKYISGATIIDSVLSPTSTNAVQNRVVDAAIKAVLPSGGEPGHYLRKTSTGSEWITLVDVPTWKPTTTYMNDALVLHPDRAYIMKAEGIGAGAGVGGESAETLAGIEVNVPTGTVFPDSADLQWIIYNITDLDNVQKKITYGTADPTGGSDGDVYIQYEV